MHIQNLDNLDKVVRSVKDAKSRTVVFDKYRNRVILYLPSGWFKTRKVLALLLDDDTIVIIPKKGKEGGEV